MSIDQLNEQDKLTWLQFIESINNIKSFKPILIKPELNTRLDLHGLTIHQAHIKFREFISDHWMIGNRKLVVITGKSGGISQEFIHWCVNWPEKIHHYEPLNDKKNQVGAYRIWLTVLK